MPIAKPPFPRLQKGHPLAKGLAGAWLFADGSVQSATDSSGYGSHGVGGSSTNQWLSGPFGFAYRTGGLNFAPGKMPHFKAAGPISASTYIREHAPTYLGSILEKGYDGTLEPFVLRSSNLFFSFETYNGAGPSPKVVEAGAGHSMEVWYHVVGVFDGAQWLLYINGVLNNTTVTTVGPTDNGEQLGIFASSITGSLTRGIDADVDHVMLWQRALSAKDVADLYADPYAMFRPTRLRKKPGGAAYVLVADPVAFALTGECRQSRLSPRGYHHAGGASGIHAYWRCHYPNLHAKAASCSQPPVCHRHADRRCAGSRNQHPRVHGLRHSG